MAFVVKKGFGKANISRTIRFTEEIFERITTVASEKDVSINSLVLQCCKYALDDMEPVEDHNK